MVWKMRIKDFEIKNFRSISGLKSKLDQNLTTLIGANEAGKTNILKALASLDKNYNYLDADLCTFSKVWNLKRDNKIENKDIEMVTIVFELNNEDKSKLFKINPNFENVNNIKCTKNLDNSYFFEVGGLDLLKLVETDRSKKITGIIFKVDTLLDSYYDNYNNVFIGIGNKKPSVLYNDVHEGILNFLGGNEETSIEHYYEIVRYLSAKDKYMIHNAEILINEIDSLKTELVTFRDNEMYLFEDLINFLPNFVYIGSYEELKDSYDLEGYFNSKDKFKTLNNLFDLAGLDIERVTSFSTPEMQAELSHCSNKLTLDFNQYWTQDNVVLKIYVAKEIAIMMEDGLINGPQRLSLRSQGLLNALSIFVNLMPLSDNTIIFLDDPGVYLHPSGQKDILNMMDKISESKQIVFSTHSPFMINRDKLDSVRLLYKEKDCGTLIKKAHNSDHDAFAPIRAAIGMNINDLLFNGNKTIMVEGQSDNILLSTFSQLLFKLNKSFIDLSKYAIFPVNGANKMLYFSSFFSNQNFNFLNILDHDNEGRNTAKNLKKRFNNDINIICLNEIVSNNGKDVEVEDLINFEYYLEAFNLVYGPILKKKMNIDTLSNLKNRSFRGLKEWFKLNKSVIGDLDKILVASKIREMIMENKLPDEDTINKFATLFDKVNKLE